MRESRSLAGCCPGDGRASWLNFEVVAPRSRHRLRLDLRVVDRFAGLCNAEGIAT